MDVVYGIDVTDKHDHFITIAERALQMFSDAASPGAFLVDIFPARTSQPLVVLQTVHDSFPTVRYVPKWFPGAEFQRIAALARKLTDEMVDEPVQEIEKSIVRHLTAAS